jgi:hypothetical protein
MNYHFYQYYALYCIIVLKKDFIITTNKNLKTTFNLLKILIAKKFYNYKTKII